MSCVSDEFRRRILHVQILRKQCFDLQWCVHSRRVYTSSSELEMNHCHNRYTKGSSRDKVKQKAWLLLGATRRLQSITKIQIGGGPQREQCLFWAVPGTISVSVLLTLLPWVWCVDVLRCCHSAVRVRTKLVLPPVRIGEWPDFGLDWPLEGSKFGVNKTLGVRAPHFQLEIVKSASSDVSCDNCWWSRSRPSRCRCWLKNPEYSCVCLSTLWNVTTPPLTTPSPL